MLTAGVRTAEGDCQRRKAEGSVLYVIAGDGGRCRRLCVNITVRRSRQSGVARATCPD